MLLRELQLNLPPSLQEVKEEVEAPTLGEEEQMVHVGKNGSLIIV